jgi:O-acetyl-ADP-ribose deacetylase (regulator of RNase III)
MFRRWSSFFPLGARLEVSLDCEIVYGDLLDQRVDAIVNAWNRNLIPWWLLLPQGVSGAIKRRGGSGPFRELGGLGLIPLGGAVVTSAGRLPYAAIIHVAGIDSMWRASEWSICESVRNAIAIAIERGYERVAFPVIGAGSGGFDEERALALIVRTLRELPGTCRVAVVRYRSALSQEARGRGEVENQ